MMHVLPKGCVIYLIYSDNKIDFNYLFYSITPMVYMQIKNLTIPN
jgi:hypothetical protein